jgi:hypothetical protein
MPAPEDITSDNEPAAAPAPRSVWLRTPGFLEPGDLRLKLAGLLLQAQDLPDACHVQTRASEHGYLLQACEIIAAVPAGASRAAAGLNQALALVDPQGLRVEASQLGGYRDAEQPMVQIGPVRGHHDARKPR